ncbi:MAG: hypothetical protein HYS12_20145 [Planctomycetes bacterium]|nr:hypothetical protein [Planctomycetota bacterium]
MSESLPDAGLSTLEEALGRLTPLPGSLSRDRVLFEAGRASARPGRRWPLLAATSSLLATVLGLLLLARPAPSVVERTVLVRVSEPSARSFIPPREPSPDVPVTDQTDPTIPVFAPAETDYLRRRQEVLRWGVDVLPAAAPRSRSSQPLTPAELRQFPDVPSKPSKLF